MQGLLSTSDILKHACIFSHLAMICTGQVFPEQGIYNDGLIDALACFYNLHQIHNVSVDNTM